MKNKDLKESYQQQLNNPLWKEKRDFIVEQRGNKCERCGESKNLQVHHKKYIRDRLAWEYDDSLLECLCGGCHIKEHDIVKNPKEDTFGIKAISINEVNKILKLRALIIVNLNDEVMNSVISTSEVLKVTDRVIRFKVHRSYLNYLKSKFGYCTEMKNNYVDIIIKKAIKNENIMDFTK